MATKVDKLSQTEVKLTFSDADNANKAMHDLRAGINTLGLFIASIKDGYRFDDQLADVKIKALEKAFGVIRSHTDIMVKALEKL